MEAPGRIVRYEKGSVSELRIFADTTEFIESCDKGFEGMDDVTRTEYIRADLLAAKDAGMSNGAADVLAERRRQIESEGFNATHDDAHGAGEKLVHAAVSYALADGNEDSIAPIPASWPWNAFWWKPKSKRRNLVRAAALIIAEIDRMDRAALKGVE